MAVIKCKMCGGDIQLAEDKTFGTCEYCGSVMTLPKVSDEQRAAAFNRGNHFRRMGEFDKALAVYERIVAEDDGDAEAHWCCALCRFGIEYVEDPTTYEWLPTCHRASFDSFLEDVDYLAAVEHSDGITRRQYQKDAAKIAEVQRGILATSQNAEPYDVFISYKELDAKGERTKDSILAQDIYYQLTEKGWRVFFSRISLEDVPGTQYEPYIFAALNSAKVMIVVGTSAENLNAVWVKNELSRYLSLMRKDRSKLLLPCYRDMDPYDLPEQLSVLMSYDMGKIGFIQDLIRGVGKVLEADKPKEETPAPVQERVIVQQSGGGPNATALLKRGQQALEDAEWDKAKDFFDQVLSMDAENAEAFLGLFLASAKCSNEDAYIERVCVRQGAKEKLFVASAKERTQAIVEKSTIENYLPEKEVRELFIFDHSYFSAVNAQRQHAEQEKKRFLGDRSLSRARQYAKGDTAARIESFRSRLFERLDADVRDAEEKEKSAKEARQKALLEHFDKAEAKAGELRRKAEEKREKDYLEACHAQETAETVEQFDAAIKKFKLLLDYKDCKARTEQCETEIRKIEEREKKKTRKLMVIAAASLAAVIALLILTFSVIIPGIKYKKALTLKNSGDYEAAITAFEELDGYKDSAARIAEATEAIQTRDYSNAEILLAAGEKGQAAIAFSGLDGYRDAEDRGLDLWDEIALRDTISADEYHTVGLRSDGTVVAAGSNGYSQYNVSDWRDIVAISASEYYIVGLRSDGTVVAAGSNGYGQYDESDWRDIVAISAGEDHTVGLRSDGTVVAAGSNKYGQCDVSDWRDIVAISAGRAYTVGLQVDGTVVAVGYNGYGQCNVSDWRDIVAISAGAAHTVGLRSDGTVVTVGGNGYGECDVRDWRDIAAVSAGVFHTVGLQSDGTVVAVGSNWDGQCDVSDWTDIKIPNA